MSRPDNNMYSFNGPHYNGFSLDWRQTDPNIIPQDCIADTLKFSTGLRDFSLELGFVTSGYEDVVDVNNRCDGLTISAELWVLKNCTMGFTVKGGSRNVKLYGMVSGHGRECDVDFGNASDQSHEWVQGCTLALIPALKNDRIYVRLLGAEAPIELPGTGPYRYVFPWKNRMLRLFTVKTFLEWRRFQARFNRK